MTDPHSPADRLEGFAAEADTLENVDATNHESEVAVSVIGDESKASVDLRPVFQAAIRYGLLYSTEGPERNRQRCISSPQPWPSKTTNPTLFSHSISLGKRIPNFEPVTRNDIMEEDEVERRKHANGTITYRRTE